MPNTKMNETVPIINGFITEPQTGEAIVSLRLYKFNYIQPKTNETETETERPETAGQVSPPPVHSASTCCRACLRKSTRTPAPHPWTQYLGTPRSQYNSSICWSDIGPLCQPRISWGPQAQRKGSILALEEKLANTGWLRDDMSISSVAISSEDAWLATIHNFDLSLTL